MRLLLTGATGFVGRHIVSAASNWTVTRLTRAPVCSAADELALGPGPWTRADFSRALEVGRPDVVIHCAGAIQSSDARACFDTNTALAAELLGAAVAASRPPRVMLIGSAAEYGNVPTTAQPTAETHPCAPLTDYAIAKHAQSLLGFAAAKTGLPVLVARLFNAVGVGMPANLALPSFARQIVGPEQHPILRVGDLAAARDFVDVEEAARLLLSLAEFPHWPWPVINICSGQAYCVRDLLNGLIAASGVPVRILAEPTLMRPGDMPVLVGSTRRLISVGLTPALPDFATLLPRLLADAHYRRGQMPKVL